MTITTIASPPVTGVCCTALSLVKTTHSVSIREVEILLKVMPQANHDGTNRHRFSDRVTFQQIGHIYRKVH